MDQLQLDDDSELPIAPFTRGVVCLPPGSTRVADADEEVFLLYTNLAGHHKTDTAGTTKFRGLGHIDSHEDILAISLALGTPAHDLGSSGHVGKVHVKHKGRASSSQKRKARKSRAEDVPTLEVEIFQDKTALRSRKGDTGSVLWHASVDFAEAVLRQVHQKVPDGFLSPETLSEVHVVELGAGTGLLSIVLSPFVRHYTVTDIPELVPLIRKNVGHNLATGVSATSPQKAAGKHSSPPPLLTSSNVTATALDWVQLHNAPASLRAKLAPDDPADVVLVVDCIYHPSLLPALLTTIDHLTVPGRTAVIVVVELRAEDVIREFLQMWLDKAEDGRWEIWSVGGLIEGPYAVWVGWKDALSGNDQPER
ncbi:hypothetical protein L226DRAFT_610430 [Lentinus tigrinus ALCF2SS1-7]|uniref:uncharacterized protein n=1 Tax=Lentinus tigrinus ALCF2SS1-7 TaxID=1328758 RepID=UPI001165F88A|nr:hypothetical protein L226DRAFT_610430 [Lentinus tigrinus ALCF2SS1-7]